jgi:ornithine cyclodeaminase/alanine dehydrogenase-like protein (mu-crystallin family)
MLPYIDAARLQALVPFPAAVDALRAALSGGAASAEAPPRVATPARAGHVLLMPAENRDHVGVKVAGVAPGNPARGLPRITGTYLLHDAATLQPLLVIDGAALTLVRTAALSALAVDELADPSASRLLVYGTGPQVAAHMAAIATVRRLDAIAVAGRTPDATASFVADRDRWHFPGSVAIPPVAATEDDLARADIVACCTSATAPLFPGELLAEHAMVVAMGAHTPDARELDAETLRRSQVVVEDPATALREAADVAAAVAAGELADPLPLRAVLEGAAVDRTSPRVFRSVGMAWEDLAVAEVALTLLNRR